MSRKKRRGLNELLSILGRVAPSKNLRPNFGHEAYRFTVWLPLLSGSGKEIFSKPQVADLAEFFAHRFDGCSATTVEGRIPWRGIWKHRGKTVIDKHMLLVVYTAQNDGAISVFEYLKTVLEEAGNQKIIVIEHLPVDLLGGEELPSPAAEPPQSTSTPPAAVVSTNNEI